MSKFTSRPGWDTRTPQPRTSSFASLLEALSGLATMAVLLGTLMWAAGRLAVHQAVLSAVPAWWAFVVWAALAVLLRAAWNVTNTTK